MCQFPSVYINAKPEEKVEDAVFQIEVDKIFPNPHQPRKYFDEDALRELALSIREFGILQPLVISKIESESETGWTVRYELVTGEKVDGGKNCRASYSTGNNTKRA